MGIADDLPTLADRLANPAPGIPSRHAFAARYPRRLRVVSSPCPGSCARLERFAGDTALGWREPSNTETCGMCPEPFTRVRKGWSTPRISVPAEPKDVAKTFFDLQEWRHEADYDNARTWTADDVRGKVARARTAFRTGRKSGPIPRRTSICCRFWSARSGNETAKPPLPYSLSISLTSRSAPYNLRSASVMPAVCTATARLVVPSYTKSPTNDSMLPSKISPTMSAFRLITGEPELPPIMSLVVTKSRGVARSSLSRFSL